MKALLFGDVHLRDTSPAMCTENYLFDLITLLNQVARIAAQREVDCVAIAGDMFDNKIPIRNSHRLIQRTIELLQTFPCPVYIVPGNHDQTHNVFESVFDTQPLGVIIRSGAAHLLSEWANNPMFRGKSYSGRTSPYLDFPIYGVPWLQEWDAEDESIRDEAVHEALEGLDTSYLEPILIVTHAPFFPPGKESPYESYPTQKFARIAQSYANGPISIFYGHIHEYHGIYNVEGVDFANAGALSRGSLHEYNLNRGIFVTEWDSETGKFEIIPVPHRPAEEVFDLIKAENIKTSKIDASDFLASIGRTSLEVTSTTSIVEQVRSMKLERDVTKTIEQLLEESGK